MQKITNSTAWPPGPWDVEPKAGSVWIDEETQIKCETWRHPKQGHWCGYIHVPIEWLEAFNTEYGYEIPGAHCGITLAVTTPEGLEKIGFDCAHAWDNSPTNTYSNGEYRTLAYVKERIAIMARAVKAEVAIRNALAGV
jgi:hypothetical protein